MPLRNRPRRRITSTLASIWASSLFGKLRFTVLYVVYFAGALLLLTYAFFYRPFLNDLREIRVPESEVPEIEHLDAETIAKVGWWRNQKKSAFHRFEPEKEAGMTRLCAFGDSFTQGDEVKWNMDYPSFLNRHAKRLGLPLETLNFGSSWWGFHQTYILWEDLARKYSCDVTLLGPMTFYSSRDSAFNHPNYGSPYHLHSLYVLEQDELRRLDVLGKTHEERFRQYFSFFPTWRSLRYDRQMPAAIQSLLPDGQRLENPFYYAPPWQDSTLDTYRALLLRMLEVAPEMRVVLMQYDVLPDWFSDLQHPRLDAFVPDWKASFPYLASHSHNSAQGNDLLARRLLARIFPEAEIALPTFRTQDLSSHEQGLERQDLERKSLERQGLDKWTSLRIEQGDTAIGHFARIDPLSPKSDAEALHASGVISLLGLQPAEASLLDASWIEIDRDLRPGAEVRLRIDDEEISLGTLQEPVPGLNLGVVKVPGLAFTGDLILRDHPQVGTKNLSDAEVTVLIEDTAYPIVPPRMLRSSRGGYLAPENLPTRGTFDLVVTAEDGAVRRWAIAEWEVSARNEIDSAPDPR